MANEPERMTMTRALSARKMVLKKLDHNEAVVKEHLLRPAAVTDPMEADGGEAAFVQSKLQAIRDLNSRYMRLSRGLTLADLEYELTLPTQPPASGYQMTMKIQDWLVWKRPDGLGRRYLKFLRLLNATINRNREAAMAKNLSVKASDADDIQRNDLIVNINEKDLINEIELIEEILAELEGELTQFDSTHDVTVPDKLNG